MELRDFIKSFLNLIYKNKCLVCNCAKDDDFLCKTCAKDVNFLSPFPHRIYNNIPIYSATIYNSTIKKLIHKLKFCHVKEASYPLATILFRYFQKLNLNDDYIIIYPESNILKNLKRGYCPILSIVKNFSKLSKLKYQPNFIQKIKSTKPQYKMTSRESKIKNIKGSFRLNKKYFEKLKNKNLLLIDDITTSGATLEEVINCLNEKDFNSIICLTVARAS